MVGYLRIAALSLGLFNLLPLPFLDGSALLGALLETIKVEVEMDPEDGRTRAGRGDRTRRAVKRAVEGLTCTLSIVCLLLGIWRAI